MTMDLEENNSGYRFGNFLAHPFPEDEIVISGMSGALPLSDNLDEFKYNLDNKIEMITQVPKTHPEMPTGFGKMKDISRYDNGFFGLNQREAKTLNPMGKFLLEKTYECIYDAGLNPADLEGTRTGVFCGFSFGEYECHFFLIEHVKGGNSIFGNMKSTIANRISYELKLSGPSINTDTACSSTAYALEAAYKAIRNGECDAAIVGGSSILLAGGGSLQFARLGVLSADGHCRPFDQDGSGYVRSEGVIAMLLQKTKDAKRVYAKLVHTKTNCDGFKEQGITYPSGEAQFNLLNEVYHESGIKPETVHFIEAHATGTIVGDPEELSSIDKFYTPNRETPLLVGSVKSSIGHTETLSILASLIKVIFAMETDNITPNINYFKPRKNLDGIWEGRIKIVSEHTPFPKGNGIVGVSSFGFGGGNAHAVLQRCGKTKKHNNIPQDNLTRLVCVSGRTEEAVQVLLDDIQEKFDLEHIALIHNIFRKPIKNHPFRGYLIASKDGTLKRTTTKINFPKKASIIFGDFTDVSGKLLLDLLALPLLSSFNNELLRLLAKQNIDLNSLDSKSSSILINMLTQVTLAQFLKLLEIQSKSVFGHSFGHFACAYFKGSLTLEQFLNCTVVIAKYGRKIKTNGSPNVKIEVFTPFKDEIQKELKKTLPQTMDDYFLEVLFNFNNKNEKYFLQKKTLILEIGQIPCKVNGVNLGQQTDLLEVIDVLGGLYLLGMQPQIQLLYPKVEFPVSRGTPMISPKIKWKHDRKWFMPSFELHLKARPAQAIQISVDEEEWANLDGHVIDGRVLLPATCYLYLTWIVLADLLSIDRSKLKVTFENCKFSRACSLNKFLNLHIMINAQSGNFEICEENEPVMSGIIKSDTSKWLEEEVKESPKGENFLLNNRDIYKELRLRGYNYKGVFKSLVECNKAATFGKIKWLDDWVAFMDNMLQMKILAQDTRSLYVPTGIGRLTIDPERHMEHINVIKNGQEDAIVELPVTVDQYSGTICSGGIEIRNLLASVIPRKKTTTFPVLEKYQFVPNQGRYTLKETIRIFMQIFLENNKDLKILALELIDEFNGTNSTAIGPIVSEVLDDQPLIQSEIILLTSEDIKSTVVQVENKKFKDFSECCVAIASKFFSRNQILLGALTSLKETGYLISREPLGSDIASLQLANVQILSVCDIPEENETLVLFKKKDLPKQRTFIKVSTISPKFSWIDEVKEALKTNQEVILWCQHEPLNGIIGFANCLRREPDCENVRSLFIVDEAPDFNPELPFYKNQLNKGMAVNIYLNQSWGTYRHLILEKSKETEAMQCVAFNSVRGDLSSLNWFEGPISYDRRDRDENIIEVYYSALNFKDVMLASGRISTDIKERKKQWCVLGLEFSGLTPGGKRVMGTLNQGAMASLVKADPCLLWDVPKHWSLKEAATVPVVYCTVIYALVHIGKIKHSDVVLIHSGTGGIGQSAINICLHMGCTIFITVGTEEKREYIKKHFPQIKEQHIGCSRDSSFEQMIMRETKGRGVDIILNSLVEEKLLASARTLAPNGRFLEIGKFDLSNNNFLKLMPFKKGGSYHGIMLDKLFQETDEIKSVLHKLMSQFIDSGAVKPLNYTVFENSELEQAYRFLTTGKHIGKVLVQLRDEGSDEHIRLFKAVPTYFCNPEKSYIICGGLGGFGLELADWLILREAKNLILTSRKGITTGYQAYRVQLWKSYGCNIKISTQDITTKMGCENLLKEANALAPVDAIYNLAVILRDSIFVNQTEESFKTSFGPKAFATQYLDEASRILCPQLRDFVIFSSVSCGRGNAGQTNYGMSNSIMERICEKRHQEGYPALAIQWGAIGDVGLVAELQENHVELEIGGTLQQSIASCLSILDSLLKQKDAVIVSSIVVAEKRSSTASGNIIEVLANIIGIRDLKAVSFNSTLAELGMDSMNGVEVKQTLEREYNIFLSPNEVRNLTLARVQELYDKSIEEGESIPSVNTQTDEDDNLDWPEIFQTTVNVEKLSIQVSQMKTLMKGQTERVLPRVLFFPGIEGVGTMLSTLTEQMEIEAFIFNYLSHLQKDTFPEMADVLLPHVKGLLKPNEPFNFVAHSLGTNVVLEVVRKLEDLGYQGNVVLIDGSPAYTKELGHRKATSTGLENSIIFDLLKTHLDEQIVEKIMEKVSQQSNLEEKLRILNDNFKPEGVPEKIMNDCIKAMVKRLKACDYVPNLGKFKSKGYLYKAKSFAPILSKEDFHLNQYFNSPIEIKSFDGRHSSVLKNPELAETIMNGILN